ncbi:MAG: hypothetical protein M9941_17585 [Anaerolineae bacterium]|nr:hypothetical protein [Anaerolineae bacterium]
MSLEKKYPFIASWIIDGEIHLGQTESWQPFGMVADHGGIVWETDEDLGSLDALFDAMELAIGRWCQQHGIELIDRAGNVIPFSAEY